MPTLICHTHPFDEEHPDTRPKIHSVTSLKCFWQASCGRSGVISVLEMGRQELLQNCCILIYGRSQKERLPQKGRHAHFSGVSSDNHSAHSQLEAAHKSATYSTGVNIKYYTTTDGASLAGQKEWLPVRVYEKSYSYGFVGFSELALNGVQKKEGSHQSCIQMFP